MEEFEILTLDDNNSYINMQDLSYEGEVYTFMLKVDEEDNPTEDYLILKKIQVNDQEFEFEDIDEELELTLLDLFQKEFEKVSEN